MLCRLDNGQAFTLNTYFSEVCSTMRSQRRRYYFKQGMLKVEKVHVTKSFTIINLFYKDRFLASWTSNTMGRLRAKGLIAVVCNTLDAVLDIDEYTF